MGLVDLIDVSSKFNSNGKNHIKLYDTLQSSSLKYRKNYKSFVEKKNDFVIQKLQNGMELQSDLMFLQINGQSQLEKEINDTKKFDRLTLNLSAIHRNEMSDQIEPKGKLEELMYNEQNTGRQIR